MKKTVLIIILFIIVILTSIFITYNFTLKNLEIQDIKEVRNLEDEAIGEYVKINDNIYFWEY